MQTSLQEYQQNLVESMKSHLHNLPEHVLRAFMAIPRHPFIQHYYAHLPEIPYWAYHEREDSPEWYELVYSDEPLVTRVDQYGRTLSSSSGPGMMAIMLAALDIQPGMRVLEVGTGTGYNAALLAFLTEDPHLVTTIDIDADTIQQAKHTIPQVVGNGLTIVQGDGADGYSPNAPYDRIIVTASTYAVPLSWKEQMAPEGILVCVLEPGFAQLGGLLKAKEQVGTLQGNILNTAAFMVLRDELYTKRTIQVDFRAPLYTSFSPDDTLFPPHLMRENHDFAFFLYYEIPDLYVFQRKDDLFYSCEAYPQGYVRFRQHPTAQVELRGDRLLASRLWTRLVRCYSLWLYCGRPSITQYQFEMDDKSQALSIATKSGRIWPFLVLNR